MKTIAEKAILSDTLAKMLGKEVYAHIIEHDTATYTVSGELILVSMQLNQWAYYLLEDSKPLFSCYSFALQQVDQIVRNVVFIN